MPHERKYVPSHSGGIDACPSRANSRISSMHSHAFLARLNRSTRCAFVSLMVSLIKRSHSQKWAIKTKNPPTSVSGGWGSGTKVELRLKSQISYLQTGARYNTRNKRMDNTASGNNSTCK